MNRCLTIACLQMPVLLGKEERNIETVLRAIDGLSIDKPHVICLPELFTTGFDYPYLKKREPGITWEVLDKLAEKAKARCAYILAGTLPERVNNRVYNTLFVLDPWGQRVAAYRKIHLFPLMGEDDFFSPGEGPLVFNTSRASIGIAVCYDIRFPLLFRSMALEGAEIIFVPAQFPDVRIDHWDILLKARAIENQFFVVGVNRIGDDHTGRFPGHTCIIDPLGRLKTGGAEEGGWVISAIDLGEVERIRQALPSFLYENKNRQGRG